MPLVTATFSTGGSVVITDTVEVTAISTLSTAISANTAMIEKQFGSAAATVSPGGITSIASDSADSLFAIYGAIVKQNDILRDINTTLGKLANQMETSTTGMANVQYGLTKMSTIQAMAFADQTRNNKFQQKATNAALVDAGKEPIVVKPDEFTVAAKQTLTDIGSVNLQVKGANLLEEYLTEGITKGLTISQQWIAESAFGQFITSYYAEAKIQAQLLYADDKTKEALEKSLKEIRRKRLNPNAAA
jgi:hypothetical protein